MQEVGTMSAPVYEMAQYKHSARVPATFSRPNNKYLFFNSSDEISVGDNTFIRVSYYYSRGKFDGVFPPYCPA